MARTAIVLLGCCLAAAQARAETLIERLHAERSSYAHYWGDGEWRLNSRLWLPAESDSWTAGLYPLNTADETKEMDDLLTSALEKPEPGGDLPSAPDGQTTGKSAGIEIKDAGTAGVRRSAYGMGDCAFVSNGVYGGALRLAGAKSAIKLPDYGLTSAFSVEAWFKPERLGGTLMHIPIGPYGEAADLSLTPEGAVVLASRGKTIGTSERRLKPGVFSHVAFVYRRKLTNDGKAWRPHDCLVFVDSYPEVWPGIELAGRVTGLGTPLLLGNTPAGDAPFAGLVDDVRVSSSSRDFYQFDPAQCDALAQREIPRGLPVMRGKEELILDAPLDGTDAVEGLFKASGLPAATNRLHYTPARRGEGVIVNPWQGVRFQPSEPVAAAQGSLEFWFMPHDWDNNQTYTDDPAKANQNLKAPVFQLLVTSEDQTNAQSYLAMAVDRTSETKGFLIPYYLHPVQPGRWRHAMVTWQGYDVRLFIDGEEYPGLQGSHPVYIMRPNRALNPARLKIAALDFGGFRCALPQGATVIDEVKLYRHRLTAPEVANSYQRFLADGKVTPLAPIDLAVAVNHPLHTMSASVDLLMPERFQITAFDLQVVKTGETNAVVDTRMDVKLDDGNCFLKFSNPSLTYGEYLFKFAFKDAAGKVVKTVDMPHAHPKPAWVDNTLGLHDGEVMPPWTPMTYSNGVIECWGREISIGPAGWPAKIVSQDKTILPAAPEVRLVTDQGVIALASAGPAPGLVKQQPGVVETEGVARGGGWTVTTAVRTEFDGFMKLQTRFDGPTNAEVRELRISFPLQFADEQLFGFYTGEHWFRAAHDFRILPRPTNDAAEEIVFASNRTGRKHPNDWAGKVSFLPYVTVGDDWRQFCWLSENDRNWTQSWTNPAVTISRGNDLTRLNLNIIQAPRAFREPLTYVFGLQATPIRPLERDFRTVQNRFSFGQVCGFNGHYMQARFGGHTAFLLAPRDLDWTYPVEAARAYRGGDAPNPGRPLLMYLDRTWQRAPEDAMEYNQDWRGWGDATRYTKPVRDAYAWYVNEWIRRGIMEGMYIDDAWIDPTKSLWHIDPQDNLSYRKDTGKAEDFSDREWGFEFFDYREMLKRIRWLFLDNKVRPLIVTHVTQTPYYPIFAFVDIMLEGEDRYLGSEKETRDFVSTWGIPRLRYASPQKWGVPVQWLPILSPQHLKPSGFPMARWYFQQNRSYMASLLLHDVSAADGGGGPYAREAAAAGCLSDDARFLGYWEPDVPVTTAESNAFASVYQLPDRLAVVLVNAAQNERVLDFAVDLARVKARLGTDNFTLRDTDTAVIPPLDKEYADLKSGAVKMKTMEAGVPDLSDTDPSAVAMADNLLENLAADEKKAADPDGDLEYHTLRYRDGKLRLRVQGDDYRLLQLLPAAAP
jgi:hypothetical protein